MYIESSKGICIMTVMIATPEAAMSKSIFQVFERVL